MPKQIKDYPSIDNLTDDDLLLIHKNDDGSYRKITIAGLKTYLNVANGNDTSGTTNQPTFSLPKNGLVSVFHTNSFSDQSNNGAIINWIDYVGYRSATGTGNSNSPTVVDNIFGNNIKGVSFNGNQYLNVDLSYLANSYYTIVVVEARTKVFSQGNNFFIGCDSSGTNQSVFAGYYTDTSFIFGQYSNDLFANIEGFSTVQPKIWITSLNSRGHEIWRNNILLNSNANTDKIQNASNGRIGRGLYGNYTGYLGLIATYIGDKSQSDIQQIFSAVNSTFKIY